MSVPAIIIAALCSPKWSEADEVGRFIWWLSISGD